jgi:hypothetical protein
VDGRELPRQQRLCSVCTSGQVEDEFHMVFECDAYDAVRERSGFCLRSLENGKALGIQFVLVGAAWLSSCSNVKAV